MDDRTLSPDLSRERALAAGEPEFLLYGLQSPINIGMILRVAETYRFRVAMYDIHGVLDDPDKLNTINDFSCGAVLRRAFRRIDSADALDHMMERRRLVATSIEPGHCRLADHHFASDDLIALGNEYDGLPDVMIERADAVMHVPMPSGWVPKPKARRPIDPRRTAPVARDGSPNLNVAITAGIICYAAFAARQGDNPNGPRS